MYQMTMREFLIWFYSTQTKSWLVSEAVKDAMTQMSEEQYQEWAELAEECEVILNEH